VFFNGYCPLVPTHSRLCTIRKSGWVRQFDAYGNYMGRVRTCNY
jgi:hypothetical protein